MSGSDDLNARRARLRALRERYERTPDFEPGDEAEWSEESPAEVSPRGGRRGGRRTARGARAGGGGAGATLQKVLQFLNQPGPGGKVVPGTNINPDRLKQAIQFLRHRAQVAEGNRAKRLQKVLSYLTHQNPGDKMISGVNIARLKQFVSLLERRGQGTGGMGALMGGRRGGQAADQDFELVEEQDEEFIDELEDEEEFVSQEPEESDAHIEGIEATLQQLVGITQRLSTQIEETQKRVDEMTRGKPEQQTGTRDAKRSSESSEEDDKSSGQGGDWFTEYLD